MNKLKWYFNRVSRCSPVEIVYRGWRYTGDYYGQFRELPIAIELPDKRALDKRSISKDLIKISSVLNLTDVSRNQWPMQWSKTCVEEAEKLLSNPALAVSKDINIYEQNLDWNYDYISKKKVPLEYGPRIHFHTGSIAESAKQIWNLNRQQNVVRLAQAFWLIGDKRYYDEVINQITSWIRQCPYMKGINWTSPTVAAKRLISWCLAIEFLRARDILPADFTRLVAKSIYQHLDFINKNYSLYSSAGNHLIVEACGSYVAASLWKSLKKSSYWEKRAYQILHKECLKQNWDDGMNKERAFGYQFLVYEMLILAMIVANKSNKSFSQKYKDRVEKMAEFIACIVDYSGNIPRFGDGDDEAGFRLGGWGEDHVRFVFNSAAIVFQRKDFKSWANNELDEKSAWLLGNEGINIYKELGTVSSEAYLRKTRAFSKGGIFVMRGGEKLENESVIVVCCGPFGYPSTAGHAHADMLSFTLNVGGEPIVIDPGVYTYCPNDWRYYFKATPQHNTLSFGDQNQSDYLHTFIWGKRCRSHLEEFSPNGEQCRFKGKVRWYKGDWHERTIDYDSLKKKALLLDKWQGANPPTIRFCLSPNVSVYQESKSRIILQKAETTCYISTNDGELEIEEAYMSPHFNSIVPTKRICLKLNKNDGTAETVLAWKV